MSKTKFTGLVAAAVVAVGAAAAVYFTLVRPLPGIVLARMQSSMFELASVSYQGSVKAEGLLPGSSQDEALTVNFVFDGHAATDEKGVTRTPLFNATLGVEAGDPELNPLQGELELKARSVDGVYYLQLSNIPPLPFFDAAFIDGVWVRIDPDALAQEPVLKAIVEGYLKELEKQTLTKQERKQLQELLEALPLVRVLETLAPEVVNGEKSHHYRVAVNKEHVISFVEQAYRITEAEPDELELSNIMKELRRDIDVLDALQAELWIGKKTKQLRRISMMLVTDGAGSVPFKGTVGLDMTMFGFNEVVTVEAPESSLDVTAVIARLFGGFGLGAANAYDYDPTTDEFYGEVNELEPSASGFEVREH